MGDVEADLPDLAHDVARIDEERRSQRTRDGKSHLDGRFPQRPAPQRAVTGLVEPAFAGGVARQEVPEDALRPDAAKRIAAVRVRAPGVKGAEEQDLLIALPRFELRVRSEER